MSEAPIAEKVELFQVASTNLSAIGYNETKQILAVQFAGNGQIFHYTEVPQSLVDRLLQSESFGRFYSSEIRGRFHGARMTGPCASCGDEGWIGETCADCGTAKYEAAPYTPKQKGEKTDESHD